MAMSYPIPFKHCLVAAGCARRAFIGAELRFYFQAEFPQINCCNEDD
jgi:hypothetical protein